MLSARTTVATGWATALALLLGGCGDGSLDGTGRDAAAGGDAGTTDAASDDAGAPALDAGPDDAGAGADAASPEAMSCAYHSASFGGAMQELDVGPTSTERLVFDVAGLPDPALVESATLRFDSWDADHPGEEGRIWVNGAGPFDLPAAAAWDNATGTGSVDVTAAVVAGDNRVEFGPGPLDRSFFRIGNVEIVALARVDDCTPATDPPPDDAVVRRMHFSEASYTNRSTWVIPCAPGEPGHSPLRNYAFTAYGDEHDPTDCDGGYVPGGDRRGTATFRFEDVVAARYRIVIRARHTENRNPSGALFIVDGEERRIDQTTSSDYEDDLWGERALEGTVDVVLDSSRESQSDAVTEVRLEPVAG